MNENKISLLIWNIQIPVMISLDEKQKLSQAPPPMFLFISRVHYISLYFKQIHDYFSQFFSIKPDPSSIWLEYKGDPVFWNLPFGIYFDLIKNHYDLNGIKEKKSITFHLPLELILHYTDYPANLIYKKPQFSEKQYYFWDLKQASCIKFDNDASNILMSMPAKKYDLLWDYFFENKRLEFIEIFKSCWDPAIHIKDKKKTCKVLPVRIFLCGKENPIKSLLKIQRGITIEKKEEQKTVFEGVKEILPDLENFQVFSYGVKIPLETPLLYLYENLFYYDGFAYLVVSYVI